MAPLLLPDVSHYQPILTADKAACAKKNCIGILFKATEATGYTDPHFHANVSAAKAAGLAWGAYHFMRQGSGAAQAQHFYDEAKGAAFFMMDWEDGDRNTARDFLSRLGLLTGAPIVQYIGAHGRANGGAFDGLPTMVPHYGPAALEDMYKPSNAPLAAWQYTNHVTNGSNMPTNVCSLGGDTSVVYRPELMGLDTGPSEDELAFADWTQGVDDYRAGKDLNQDWDADRKKGWTFARWAANNPKADPGTLTEHTHDSGKTGGVSKA